jgi:hypothetical protein
MCHPIVSTQARLSLLLRFRTFLLNHEILFITCRPRTKNSKDIKTSDPVPIAGQEEALALMQSGRMYRYNVKSAESSVISLCEQEIAEYTGHKYCVALNSCGSALILLLKCSGIEPGDEVVPLSMLAVRQSMSSLTTYDHVMDQTSLEKTWKSIRSVNLYSSVI